MAGQHIAQLVGDLFLELFDLFVVEFYNSVCCCAHEVIMVFAMINFEDRMTSIEVMPFYQASLLELGQHAVYGGQANIVAGIEQRFIDVLSAHVMIVGLREDLKYLDAREGDFETCFTQFLIF